jgi:hypothetical protein
MRASPAFGGFMSACRTHLSLSVRFFEKGANQNGGTGTRLADFFVPESGFVDRQTTSIFMQTLEKSVTAFSAAPICPSCKGVIPGEDINVASDVAYCRKCNLSHSLSALTYGTAVDESVDLSRPPAGAWFRREGSSVVAGATNRSLGNAFGLLFFMLFWNGIVSVFVAAATASTLRHLGVSLPGWVPASMAKQGAMPVPLNIFLWLFLTPFIAIGVFLIMSFFNCLAGRTEVLLQQGQGVLFTGVGPVGFRKRFAASEVSGVRIEDRQWHNNQGGSGRTSRIVIDTKSGPLNFGSMLTYERRWFLAGALKKELAHR